MFSRTNTRRHALERLPQLTEYIAVLIGLPPKVAHSPLVLEVRL